MNGKMGTTKVVQVGFIVHDIETTKAKWAEFLGVDIPETVDLADYETTKATYMGEPALKANCKMAFITVGDGVQLELIEPNDEPSTWRDYLDTHGEGMHHLAFRIQNGKEVVMSCADFGASVIQQGLFKDQSGQYIYMDGSKDLKCVIELLEKF